eukprot:366221-Chlamydomonas_euryale.AAC.2
MHAIWLVWHAFMRLCTNARGHAHLRLALTITIQYTARTCDLLSWRFTPHTSPLNPNRAVLLCSLAVPEASTPSAGGTAQSQQSALQTTRLTPRASVAGAPSPYRKVLSKSKEYMETG